MGEGSFCWGVRLKKKKQKTTKPEEKRVGEGMIVMLSSSKGVFHGHLWDGKRNVLLSGTLESILQGMCCVRCCTNTWADVVLALEGLT